MLRADFLDQAKGHVTRDRAATHGRAEDTFGLIAALWSADLGITLTRVDVARLMCLFKLARAKGNPGHADNWVDCAGYAAIGGELARVPFSEARDRPSVGYSTGLVYPNRPPTEEERDLGPVRDTDPESCAEVSL